MVIHVAGVVVFAAAGVGPKTTPVKVILEIATGGRALWARANVRGLSAEGTVFTSVGLSFLEVGSVGAPGTGKLVAIRGAVVAGRVSRLENPFLWKDFSREEVMVLW